MQLSTLCLFFCLIKFTTPLPSLQKRSEYEIKKYERQLPPKENGNDEKQYECDENVVQDILKYVENSKGKVQFPPKKGYKTFIVLGTKKSLKYGISNVLADKGVAINPRPAENNTIDLYPRFAGYLRQYPVYEAPDLESHSIAGQAVGAYMLNEIAKKTPRVSLVFVYTADNIHKVWDYFKRIVDLNLREDLGMFNFSQAESFILTNVTIDPSGQFRDIPRKLRGKLFGHNPGFLLDIEGYTLHLFDNDKLIRDTVYTTTTVPTPIKFPPYQDYEACIKDKVDKKIVKDLEENTKHLMSHFKKVADNNSLSTLQVIDIFQNASKSVNDILNRVASNMTVDAVTKPLAEYLKQFKLDKEAANVLNMSEYVKILSLFQPDFQSQAWSKGLEPFQKYLNDHSSERQNLASANISLFTCENPQNQELIDQKLYEIKFELEVDPNATRVGWIELLRNLEDLVREEIADLFKTMDQESRQKFIKQIQEKLEKYDGKACIEVVPRHYLKEPENCDEDETEEAMECLEKAWDIETETLEEIVVVLGTESSGKLQVANLLANFEINSPPVMDPLIYPEFLTNPINKGYAIYSGSSFAKEKSAKHGLISKFLIHRILMGTKGKLLVTLPESTLKEGGAEEFKTILEKSIDVLIGFNDFSKCLGFIITNVDIPKDTKQTEQKNYQNCFSKLWKQFQKTVEK